MFDLVWCVGFKEFIKSLDKKLHIPLPKMYMAHPPGSFDLAIVPRRPSLVTHEHAIPNLVWPKIESSIYFLLRWRGILEDEGKT